MASTHVPEWSGQVTYYNETEAVMMLAGEDTRTPEVPAGWALVDPDHPAYLESIDAEVYTLRALPTRFHLAA